jgi:hypothetical protein
MTAEDPVRLSQLARLGTNLELINGWIRDLANFAPDPLSPQAGPDMDFNSLGRCEAFGLPRLLRCGFDEIRALDLP